MSTMLTLCCVFGFYLHNVVFAVFNIRSLYPYLSMCFNKTKAEMQEKVTMPLLPNYPNKI